MKQCCLLFIILITTLSASGQFTDDFSDLNFTANPTWAGEDAHFEVDVNSTLHLNAPAVTDASYLSTPFTAFVDADWQFLVKMDFNPSSSNYCNVYLMSTENNLESPLNGYFVQIGGSNDEVSLYRQTGSTVVKIIDGLDGILNTNLVNVRVHATRSAGGNWTLEADTSGNYNFISQGSITNTDHLSCSYFGLVCDYTSTRSDKFYFDDFTVSGNPLQDSIAPLLTGYTMVDNQTLQLHFNESLEASSAENQSNYTLNGGIGNPSTALLEVSDDKTVTLSFASPMNTAQNYQLTYNNIQDLSLNALTNQTLNFVFFISDTAEFLDVVINEIFFDPTPQIGLPEAEFIEIYNASNKNFDLQNWDLINTSTSNIIAEGYLLAGQYAILCDVDNMDDFAGFGHVIGVTNFSSISSPDSLSLRSSEGLITDVVSFNDSWYQNPEKTEGGYSIERKNPTHICSAIANWGASNSAIGGTPGTQNTLFTIQTDATAPQITTAFTNSANGLQINFNEGIGSGFSSNVFSVNPTLNIDTVLQNQTASLLVLFDSIMDSLTVYQLTINGLSDCYGNSLLDSFYFATGVQAESFDLLITEILFDPDPNVGALPDAEYIEVYNNSNKPISTANLSLMDGSTAKAFPRGSILPGDYMILCDDGKSSLFPQSNKLIFTSFPSLSNTGKYLGIRDLNLNIIHQLTYSPDWYNNEDKNEGGWSIEMINPNNPCGEEDNWMASESPNGGTPGAQNALWILSPDVQGPILLSANASGPMTIILKFDQVVDEISAQNINNYTISDPTLNIVFAFLIGTKTVQLSLSDSLEPQIKYSIKANNIEDCSANIEPDNKAILYLPEKAIEGDIIINELLFDPISGGSDYVEIYNKSTKAINLSNWSLASPYNDSIGTLKTITQEALTLLPEEYLLLSKDNDFVMSEYIVKNENSLLEMNDFPSYNNGEGVVYLIDNTNQLIDEFAYTENMHHVLLDFTKGVALERLSFTLPTSEVTNWHSASENAGFGTPGYENSQSLADFTPQETLQANPEIFSPDNDGYHDIIQFSYQLDKENYVGNGKIFDEKGRSVKLLVDNQLLGTSGSFIWDGEMDNGEIAGLGIYVLWLEVFDTQGNSKAYKKAFSLATKLN